MIKWSGNKIRKTWLDFFVKNNHFLLQSQSLIPHNDQSLLWINSGVATLKPYFSGIKNPPSNRLTSCQKSIRTNDIFNIGVTSRHHTFFEMLGNFSIGDYFKTEAIDYAYDLLVNHFKLPLNKLYISVYQDDLDAYNYWIKKGINPKHIVKGNKERNFWDVGSGPCGPCSEIYFDRGEKFDPKNIGKKLFFEDIENDRYVEIWNIVFSQFNNNGKNEYSDLAKKNIDTGAGLERLACILQETPTNYDTDLFIPTIKVLEKYTQYKYDPNAYFSNDLNQKKINKNFIIIIDHLKANMFAIADGANPSSKLRGGVLRKLIRRAMISADFLKMDMDFVKPCIHSLAQTMQEFYPYLSERENDITKIIVHEQSLFLKTLNKGMQLFNDIAKAKKNISGEIIFKLTDTYGFPYEVIENLCKESNLKFDAKQYEKLLAQHQKISRSTTASQNKAMIQQNANLINFKLPAKFNYDSLVNKKAKIIALFDLDFNPNKIVYGEGYFVVDSTPFYATSGGQMHDNGYCVINNKKIEIIDVIKSVNGQHLHKIDAAINLRNNDEIELYVDKLNRELTTKNHSCEHLLQKALKEVISNSIHQEGASKDAQHLTFYFSHTSNLTNQQIIDVENKVNEYIKSDQKVTTKLMNLDQAKAFGAEANFENVYSKINGLLRVVIMGKITSEVCGGTHVKSLGEIEQFLITKIESKRSGEYKVIGITSNQTANKFIKEYLDYCKDKINKFINGLNQKKIVDKNFNKLVKEVSYDISRSNYHKLTQQIKLIEQAYAQLIKQNDFANKNLLSVNLKNEFKISKKCICWAKFNQVDLKIINSLLHQLTNENPQHSFVVINVWDNKIQYIIMNNKQFNNTNYYANKIISELNKISHGSGGGNMFYAQGGSSDLKTLSKIESYLNNLI